MPSRWVQRDAALVGPLQTITCTLATPQETTLAGGSYLTIPNAEPATPQFSYTIQQSDMPTINAGSFRIIPVLGFAGFWTSGAGTGLSFRYERVRSGTTTSLAQSAISAGGANNYYTGQVAGANTFDTVVGDTVQLKIWAPAGVVADIRWYSLAVLPTRIVPHASGSRTYLDVSVVITAGLTYTGGVAPTIITTRSWFYYPFNTTTNVGAASSYSTPPWLIGETNNYGIGRCNFDLNTADNASATTQQYPRYSKIYFPSQITYRLTSL